MEEEVLEGYLCPICMIDFKSIVTLDLHFQDKHSDEQKFTRAIKDVVKSAKKFLNKDQLSVLTSEPEVPGQPAVVIKGIPGYAASTASESSLGATHSHTHFFKTIRSIRMEGYATQTNNLLIRLSKLLENLPSDPLKRKAYEQQIVPWMDDKNVKLCPGCALAFGILRRRHHCRLCGAVMCNDCSNLLPIECARKITSTVTGIVSSSPTHSEGTQTPQKLLRSSSASSVQSVLSLDHSLETHFRLCSPCFTTLQWRERITQVRTQKPIICQFYERLRAAIDETEPLLQTYMKMHSSLSAGETIHSLNDAHGIRVKILRLAESIDSLSKKIAVLGQNTETPPQGAHLGLQKTVRTAAGNFLKENIISLPNLPTEEQLKEFQELRREEIAREIEERRMLVMEADQRAAEQRGRSGHSPGRVNGLNPGTGIRSRQQAGQSHDTKVTLEDSWTPEVTKSVSQSEDPIIEQMNIIQGFIKQARAAGRLDEVVILEENLAVLREGLWQKEQEAARLRDQ